MENLYTDVKQQRDRDYYAINVYKTTGKYKLKPEIEICYWTDSVYMHYMQAFGG